MVSTDLQLVEVGPRDGLQNEPLMVSTDIKVAFINRLSATGLRVIEATSFVSSRKVPQLADGAEVLRRIERRSGVRYAVLTPNATGFRAAYAAGADEVAVFAAASETFSQRNLNCSINESFDRFAPVCAAAKDAGVPVRGYVSCVLGCPFEGQVPIAAVTRVARRLAEIGCYQISLGDTIGVGTPNRARQLVEAVAADVPLARLAVHFHDMYGQALANILSVVERGVSVIDTAVGGLGGCPYAPGATGNVASEDVVYMLEGMGINTGVDLERLSEAAWFIGDAVGRPPKSKVSRAMAHGERSK